jgi:hypothetical protein
MTLSESSTPSHEGAIMRNHARQLRRAAAICKDNIQNHGWVDCKVTVAFENNRQITIKEAESYANELDRIALRKALDIALVTPGATGPGLTCNMYAGADRFGEETGAAPREQP